MSAAATGTGRLDRWREDGRALFPGVLASVVVAAAATFISGHYGAPVMLMALLLGMAMNFLSGESACAAGIQWTSRQVLRAGVALLGLRITFGQITDMGWLPLVLVVGSVVVTILVSMAAARLMGFRTEFGVLSGGAVAICGASAALALATVLPNHPLKERATTFTVIGVSMLSTLAMVAYPLIAHWLGMDAHAAGIFLGATIHDVAQVVGAGYSISTEAGDTATFVKLLRVAMLMPVLMVVAAFVRSRVAPGEKRPPILPWFAVVFALLVVANSLLPLPKLLLAATSDLSRWLLVIAIAAIGMKTRLQDLVTVGWRPVALMTGQTLFLALLVLFVLRHYA